MNTPNKKNSYDASKAESADEATKPEKPASIATKDAAREVDVFLLEKIYPEPHELFRAYPEPKPDSDCIIVLDTNALLLPYAVAKDDLTKLEGVYSKIADEGRLLLPGRVAREFFKNRDHKLAEMVKTLSDFKSKMNIGDASISPLLDGLKQNESLKCAYKKLNDAKYEYLNALDSILAQVRSWRGNDHVTGIYARIFTKSTFIKPSLGNEELEKQWNFRRKNKIPPGYKDSNKDDTGIGDFIIWMTLLNIGSMHKKDLIFVTGEAKADWFVKANHERIYPRPELLDEYRRASEGRTIRLSSLHDLLKEMDAPANLVTEVEAAEFSANNALILASAFPQVHSIHTTILTETATFDYSTNDGRMRIDRDGRTFDLRFSKASDTSIRLYVSGTTRRIARIRREAIDRPTTMDQNDTSSTHYLIQSGDGFLVENEAGDVLAARIINIQDDTRGADRDEIFFTFTICDRGTRITMP